MKKFRNALILVLCALLLVGGTFAATLAYLTADDSVTNTFAVGDIDITLDEADVDEYGNPIDEEGNKVDVEDAVRVEANPNYLLVPNKEYSKDPIIHVAANSEDSYIFVQIENNIADALVTDDDENDDDGSIADQLAANGWVQIGTSNVYYNSVKYEKNDEVVDYPVFETIYVKADITNDALATAADGKQITVTGYAVQAEGFANAEAAWTATFGAPAGDDE